MKFFIDNLLWLKKQHNFTQEDLAEKLNVSRQSISKWERGEALPDLFNLAELSRLYNISIDDLLNKNFAENKEDNVKVDYSEGCKNGDNLNNDGEFQQEKIESCSGESDFNKIFIDDNNGNTVAINENKIQVKSSSGEVVNINGFLARHINHRIDKFICNKSYTNDSYFAILNISLVKKEELEKTIATTYTFFVDEEEFVLIGVHNINILADVIYWENAKDNCVVAFHKREQIKIKVSNNGDKEVAHIAVVEKRKFKKYNKKYFMKIIKNHYKADGDYKNHFTFNELNL